MYLQTLILVDTLAGIDGGNMRVSIGVLPIRCLDSSPECSKRVILPDLQMRYLSGYEDGTSKVM